jgi:hypothetical protein
MTRSGRSTDSEDNGTILERDSSMLSAADGLVNNPERNRQKYFAWIWASPLPIYIVFSPGLLGIELFGRSALENAFGWTMILLSAVGINYGNYRLLAELDRPIQGNSTTLKY